MANNDVGIASSGLVSQLSARPSSRKATKAETNYQPENEEGRECGGCVHFMKEAGTSDGTCEEVAGSIFHEYVCDLFESDRAEKAGES